MLRSILTTCQNQKSKIVLWCLVALTVLLFARIAIKHIWSYKNIIATTPATKAANALLQTIIESYNGSHSLSQLRIYEISNFDENAHLNSGESIDFAVIAPGTTIPKLDFIHLGNEALPINILGSHSILGFLNVR
jgi:hypothetical protein